MNPIWIGTIVATVLRHQHPRDVPAPTPQERWLRNESVGNSLRSARLSLKDIVKRVLKEGVAPRTDRVFTGMRGRSWLTAILIRMTAEWITQDSPCSVLAAQPEGWRHDVS